MQKNPNIIKNKLANIFIVALIATVLVGGGIYTWQNKNSIPEVTTINDCTKLGDAWDLFSNKETSLTFCYPNSWGEAEFKETSISPQLRNGTQYHISFSESINNQPLISFSTLDFQRLGPSDVLPPVNWNAIDFNKTESELDEIFPNENSKTKKLNINGKQVLKVYRDFMDPLSQIRLENMNYFIPQVEMNKIMYNVHILGSTEQESDLDKLLSTISY